jgi:chromosome partitioning protein
MLDRLRANRQHGAGPAQSRVAAPQGEHTMETAPGIVAPVESSLPTGVPALPHARPDVDDETGRGGVAAEVADAVAPEEFHDLSRVQDAAERLAVTAAPAEDGDSSLLPRVIALANQKGGVGKTTTTVNLGAALAEADYRVLLVDLDPQGNASTGVGLNLRNINTSIYDVLLADAPLEDCIEPTNVRNLFVAPSTIDLAGAEIELVPVFSREMKLRRALAPVRDDFDYVLIDCPPSLGLLTVNALAAADDVIVPIQCEYYALEGLGQLLKNVQLIQTNLNPSLRVRGIALTMFDARTKLAEQVERDVRRFFRDTVYRTVIPRTVRLSEAPSFGQPITTFDPVSRGAIAYRELAKEVSRGATRRAG